MPEYVSTAEAQSGVVGRTSLPPTILQPDQQQQPQPPQFAPQPSVDTGALINQAIDARRNIEAQRQGLSAQRAQIIQQMSAVPPGRRGARQEAALNAQLRGLDFQERDLTSQQHFQDFATREQMSATFRNAQMAHKLSQEQLTHQTAQEAAEVFLKGTEIMGKYKPGTQEFQDAMVQLRDQYPLGFASEAVKGHFGQIAKFHDAQRDATEKRLGTQLSKTTGLTPEEFAAIPDAQVQAGVIVEPKSTGTVVHTGAEGFDDSGRPKGTFSTDTSVFIPPEYKNTPWEKIPADVKQKINDNINRGGAIQINLGTHSVVLPRTQYEAYKNQFSPQPTNVIPNAPQTPTADAEAQAQGYRDASQYQEFLRTGRVTQPTGQPAVAPAPAATAPPAAENTRPTVQIGERRPIGGVLAEWDGRGWKKVTQ